MKKPRISIAFLLTALPALACARGRTPPERSRPAEGSTAPAPSTGPFSDAFSEYPDGLLTNEWAHWNPDDPRAKTNPNWEMTSGSLFAKGGAGWSGAPDDKDPGPESRSGNGSSVFRLTTQRADFGNVAVSFELLNQGLTETRRTPKVDWDGVHVFLRYRSQYELYYASVNRRDNAVIIKKKTPGGPSNGGTYHNMTQEGRYEVPYGRWQAVRATVRDNADGSVSIDLYADGKLLVSATDDGKIGGPPLRGAGKTGIRGDNADIKIKDFHVDPL
jgi:hypothetical protein